MRANAIVCAGVAIAGLLSPPPAASAADWQLNEIVAINGGPTVDEDGEESDWVELINRSATTDDLAGWYLTDDAADLTKWQFPQVSVPGGSFLMVFASGKGRAVAGSELHAGFKLDADGEYLALVEPDGVTVHHEFTPAFRPQYVGISYGIAPGTGDVGYFTTPTPMGANATIAATGFITEPVEFDVSRGYFEAPFDLRLSSAAAGAEIYYSTDSSIPAPGNGTLYSGPIAITETTVVRAGAYRPGEVPVDISTQTYIFLDDVLDQPANPPGFPNTWQPSVSADYEMDDDPRIGTAAEIKAALRSLPTVSLSMPVDDWFNPNTNPAVGGIYSNSKIAYGAEWEREVSAEFFDFPHGQELQVNCGIRVFGNASRNTDREKHNMRLVFRRSYGPTELEFPLFGNDEVPDKINGFMLRGQNGDSWFHPSVGQQTEALYLRDQLPRDLQRRMDQPNTRQDHAHLYINGLYWGVFNTIERIEASSMAENYGGPKEQWDVIKSSRVNGMEVVDGSMDVWNQVQAMANAGLADPADYAAIQEFFNLENFVDWILINFWNGNSDWDDNNFQVARRRLPGEKFRFFVWDSERSLLSPTANNTGLNYATRGSRIHTMLRANPEYRLYFADRVHKHFFNDGVLTPDRVRAVFNGWVETVRVPLIAESARWGDAKRPGNPYRVDAEWQREVDYQNNTYMASRTATVLSQLKAQGLYPDIDAPSFNQHGGEVPAGFRLTMGAASGTIYYTLDGSDPRVPPASGGETVLLDEGAAARAFVPGDDTLGTTWREPGFDDSNWQSGVTGVGAETIPDNYADLIGLPVAGAIGQNATVYVRIPFTIADQAQLDQIVALTVKMKYDDGFVAFINGVEVASANSPAALTYDSNAPASRSDSLAVEFEDFDASAGIAALTLGHNVLAIHALNSSSGNSDLLVSPQLVALSGSSTGISPSATTYAGETLTLAEPVVASARVLDGGEWSALNRATFLVATEPADAGNLAITEIQYRPGDAIGGGEWIELANIGPAPIDLRGVRFIDGVKFDFAIDSDLALLVLAPGQRLVVVGNRQSFTAAYPDPNILVAGEFVGDLENDGERLVLQAADDSIIQNFRFNDRHPWPEAADGGGFTLVLRAPDAKPDPSVAGSWRSSVDGGGSPGGSDASIFPGGDQTALLAYALGEPPLSPAQAGATSGVTASVKVAADDVESVVEVSTDLVTWQSGGGVLAFTAASPPIDGVAELRYESLLPQGQFPNQFFRVRVTLRSSD